MNQTMKKMTPAAMARVCNGIYHGSASVADKEISSITTDSRKVSEGGLFIAIKGARSDGHDFIGSCFDAGAMCCISEKDLPDEERPYIQVKSSLEAVKQLAAYYRSVLDIKVVGITGSVGKTSTKETIASVLGKKYRVLKTLGNFNNELGLPLTIFRLRDDDEVAVLEMGISDFGEMSRLTAIARPDICVITNIGLCHLENLKNRDGILKAKAEIFEGLKENGSVILNGDDDKLVTVTDVNGKTPVFFGISNRSGVYAKSVATLGLEGTKVVISGVGTKDIDVIIPVPGKHMVYNVLAAAAVGAELGLNADQIKSGIEELKTIDGRNNIIKTDKYLILDDCYNANPISMKAALDILNMSAGRKVAILGDMFELGDNEEKLHFEVGEYLAATSIDVLAAVGKLSKNIVDGVISYKNAHADTCSCRTYHFDNKEALIDVLPDILETKDNILVKASHGMEFPQIIQNIKNM